VKEDQWGDLECLHKACQTAITDGGLFTDTALVFGHREHGTKECSVLIY